MATVIEQKRELRTHMKAARGSMTLTEHRTKSGAIMQRCMTLPQWEQASTVHLYVSCVNNEVDTIGLLYALFDRGARVVVPRCGSAACELAHIELKSLDELTRSDRCLMEPPYQKEREVAPEQIDLVIAPVVAFDRAGGRLGMGGGYYDTFLAACTCPIIGFAFSLQEVQQVPMSDHDQRLDFIITEQETIQVAHD